MFQRRRVSYSPRQNLSLTLEIVISVYFYFNNVDTKDNCQPAIKIFENSNENNFRFQQLVFHQKGGTFVFVVWLFANNWRSSGSRRPIFCKKLMSLTMDGNGNLKHAKTTISNIFNFFSKFLIIFQHILPPNFRLKHAHKLKPGTLVNIGSLLHVKEVKPLDRFCGKM